MQTIDTNLLPGVLPEMVELIGIADTMKIVEEYGGVRLYIPQDVPPEHPLAALIGLENAQKLAGRFGGERPEIPLVAAVMRQARDIEIRSLWPGLSQRQLALKYKTTERNIRLILGKCERDENQMQLFE